MMLSISILLNSFTRLFDISSPPYFIHSALKPCLSAAIYLLCKVAFKRCKTQVGLRPNNVEILPIKITKEGFIKWVKRPGNDIVSLATKIL